MSGSDDLAFCGFPRRAGRGEMKPSDVWPKHWARLCPSRTRPPPSATTRRKANPTCVAVASSEIPLLELPGADGEHAGDEEKESGEQRREGRLIRRRRSEVCRSIGEGGNPGEDESEGQESGTSEALLEGGGNRRAVPGDDPSDKEHAPDCGGNRGASHEKAGHQHRSVDRRECDRGQQRRGNRPDGPDAGLEPEDQRQSARAVERARDGKAEHAGERSREK